MKIGKTLYVKNRNKWRAWLKKNHKTSREIWLIYFKKDSGKPRIAYDAALEEALCFGWIDGIIKSVDGERFVQRFTPRKTGSNLSEQNRERIRRLIQKGKMTKAGLAAVTHAFHLKNDKPGRRVAIPAYILKPLKANKTAWKNFRKFPLSYRRIRIAYIKEQKKHGQQYKRSLKNFIKMTEKDRRFGLLRD